MAKTIASLAMAANILFFLVLGATSPSYATPSTSRTHTSDTNLLTTFLSALDEDPIRAKSYYPSGANDIEKEWCKRSASNLDKCAKAKSAADIALARAKYHFPANSLHNGKGDAFRHCYWSARMTIAMGVKEAKGFGDRHEATSTDMREKDMDLRNNLIGRSVGRTEKTNKKSENKCKSMAENGKLVTLK